MSDILNWARTAELLITTGFCSALVAYVLFHRSIRVPAGLVGAAFIPTLAIPVFSAVFQGDFPMSRALVLGEIPMAALVAYLCHRKYAAKSDTVLFAGALIAILSAFALNAVGSLPFLYADMRLYLAVAFLLSLSVVLLSHGGPEGRPLSAFSFLGMAQLATLFDTEPLVLGGILILKMVFYSRILSFVHQGVHQEILKEVHEAKRIQKEFDDELRKEVKKHVFFMEQSQQKMAKISQTDALTEAYNRKGILDIIDRLVNDRNMKQFSLLMFDIDKFKNINDTLGHATGDKCLKSLSRIARACLRDGDYLGRYGGDEFMIVLSNADLETAFKVAERFRQRIAETEDPHFTVSIGVATFPFDGRNHRELMEYADKGLYIAKEKGRNQVARRDGGRNG